VVMDLQPLVVILTGRGETHGATHTLLGAAVLGVASALAFGTPHAGCSTCSCHAPGQGWSSPG
jgi:hypothetical protein